MKIFLEDVGNKNILITGSAGQLGSKLVKKFKELNCNGH